MALFKSLPNSYKVYQPDNVSDYRPTNELSLSCWIYGNHHINDQHLIGQRNLGYKIFLKSINNFSHIAASIGDTEIVLENPIEKSTWYHTVITYDYGLFKLYVNGTLAGVITTSLNYGGDRLKEYSFWAFHNDNGGGNAINLGLNYFQLWNVVLNEDDIKHIASGEDPGLIETDSVLIADFLDNPSFAKMYGRILPKIASENNLYSSAISPYNNGGSVPYPIPTFDSSSQSFSSSLTSESSQSALDSKSTSSESTSNSSDTSQSTISSSSNSSESTSSSSDTSQSTISSSSNSSDLTSSSSSNSSDSTSSSDTSDDTSSSSNILSSSSSSNTPSSSSSPSPITAKSVVFDIADNYNGNFIGVRSIEFSFSSSVISLNTSDFSAYATSDGGAGFEVENTFDTTTSKTGNQSGNQWLSGFANITNQRIIIVFNSEQTFDEIIINNSHQSGSIVDRGARSVKITYSPDIINDTTYDAAVSNGVKINDTIWPVHVSSNIADDQTVWIA